MLKFLLHTCCAPCSIAVIDELKNQYDLTVFFYNPNIYPEEEYLKRKGEVVRVCEEWGVEMIDCDTANTPACNAYASIAGRPQPPSRGELKKNLNLSPLEGGTGGVGVQYGQDDWNRIVTGLENAPEGGARCSQCFKLRLEKTAQYAKENNFDIFCTTLTSGRNKKAEVINPIGKMLGEKYGVKFLETDWKKEGRPTSAKATAGKQESRQEKATRLIKERGIYRQNYCGCKYSLNI